MIEYLQALKQSPLFAPLLYPLIAAFGIMAAGFIIDCINQILMELLTKICGKRAAYVMLNYLTFPGTVIHELSHAGMALITGAKVTEISFFDKPLSGNLGHVNYIARGGIVSKSIQHCLTSCAPVLTGAAVQIMAVVLINSSYITKSWQMVLLIYIDISILIHSSMSRQDIKNYLRGLKVVLLLIWIISATIVALNKI